MSEPTNHAAARRIAGVVLITMALGELGVGLAVLVFTARVLLILLGTQVDGVALVVARMLGISLAALSVTWWRSRRDPDLSRVAPGFIGYNVGVGLLFGAYAMAASQFLPVSWLVAAAHLLAGLAFSAAYVAMRRVPASLEFDRR